MTVHVVPHTHDDVGWVKTYEEYFTGFEGKTSNAKVQQILDQIIEQLSGHPNRKFTYVEMKYF